MISKPNIRPGVDGNCLDSIRDSASLEVDIDVV